MRYEGGVSSVPCFDACCGNTLIDAASFVSGWSDFWSQASAGTFVPRDNVTENLTLESGALHCYGIAEAVM